MDDVAPSTLKLSDAKGHALLLSRFLLENSLYFGVNEIIGFQKLIGNLDKMTVANLSRQHQRFLFQEFLRIFAFAWSYKLLFCTIYIA